LFQGASRVYNLQAAKLAGEQLAFARDELQNQITTEYAQAIASYRGALTNWRLQQENEQLAREVYQIIQLQYDEGIIPYLEVIQAETDLRSAQLNTSDALLRVLSSKVDLQRATGTVPLADISTTN
jgi:outer membrane protein TolC